MYVDHLIDQPAVFDGSRYNVSERDFMPEKKAYGTEACECSGLPEKDAEVVPSGDSGGIVQQSEKRLAGQPVFRVSKRTWMKATPAQHCIGI